MQAKRRLVGIASCFGVMTALTWERLFLEGGALRTIGPRLQPYDRFWLYLLFGVLGIAIAWTYFRVIRETTEKDLPTLFRGAVLVHLLAFPALPFTSNDLFFVLASGRLVCEGINPYLAGPAALGSTDAFASQVDPRWLAVPTDYGPISTIFGTLAAFTGSIPIAMIVFKLAMLGCSLVAIVLCRRICRGRGDAGARGFAAFALNPLLVWEISSQAHNDGLLVLAMVAFVWLVRTARWRAVTALTMGVFAKLGAVPLLGLYLVQQWRSSKKVAIAMAASIAVASAVLLSFVRTSTLRGPLSFALGNAANVTRSPIHLVLFAGDSLGLAAHRQTVCTVLTLVGYAILGVLAARAIWKTRTIEDAFAHAGLFLLVWQIVTPWYQAWYATWLLPIAPMSSSRRATLIARFAALQVIQYALPVDPFANVAIDVWLAYSLVTQP